MAKVDKIGKWNLVIYSNKTNELIYEETTSTRVSLAEFRKHIKDYIKKNNLKGTIHYILGEIA